MGTIILVVAYGIIGQLLRLNSKTSEFAET